MSSDNPREGLCGKIRQHFDAYLDGELTDDVRSEVQGHLQACADCSSTIAERERLKGAVHRAVMNVDVSVDLRRSIEQRLQENTRPAFFKFTIKKWTLALAATLLVTVGVVSILRNEQAREQLMHIGMIDHTHCTLELERWKKPVSMEEMEHATGRSALGEDFIGLIPVIQEKVGPDFNIIQGHRCTADGRRYIHVILTGKDGAIASVVISEKNGESLSSLHADAVLDTGLPLYRHGAEGLDVAAFETDRYLAYFVSNLDQAANMNVAENLAPAVVGYLQRIGA